MEYRVDFLDGTEIETWLVTDAENVAEVWRWASSAANGRKFVLSAHLPRPDGSVALAKLTPDL